MVFGEMGEVEGVLKSAFAAEAHIFLSSNILDAVLHIMGCASRIPDALGAFCVRFAYLTRLASLRLNGPRFAWPTASLRSANGARSARSH